MTTDQQPTPCGLPNIGAILPIQFLLQRALAEHGSDQEAREAARYAMLRIALRCDQELLWQALYEHLLSNKTSPRLLQLFARSTPVEDHRTWALTQAQRQPRPPQTLTGFAGGEMPAFLRAS